jgi:hypothetical protein
MENERLIERITDYLHTGGLFNPELMDHDLVRDLLIDCRTALAKSCIVCGWRPVRDKKGFNTNVVAGLPREAHKIGCACRETNASVCSCSRRWDASNE